MPTPLRSTPCRFVVMVVSRPASSHQVTRKQKVGDALANGVLMTAVPANQLTLHDLRVHKQMMQVFQCLLVGLQRLPSWQLSRQFGEAQLTQGGVSKHPKSEKRFRTGDGRRGGEDVPGFETKTSPSLSPVTCFKLLTSVAVVRNAAQSRRGRVLSRNCALNSISSSTSSASFG